MGSMCFRIRTRIFKERSDSTCTPCGSRPVSCGVRMARGATPFTLICGMTTLSDPDVSAASQRLSDLPRLPRDDGGPIFAEPWQAQAFALAVRLSEQGHFSWKEWAATLAAELQAAVDRGEPDDGSHYYEHWLAALERLVNLKGLTDSAELL